MTNFARFIIVANAITMVVLPECRLWASPLPKCVDPDSKDDASFMRDFIVQGDVFAAVPGERYYISRINTENYPQIPLQRFTVTMSRTSDGMVVAAFRLQSKTALAIEEYRAIIPEYIQLFDTNPLVDTSNRSGCYAILKLNRNALDFANHTATPKSGYILNAYNDDNLSISEKPAYAEIIHVGKKRPFKTLREAIESLQDGYCSSSASYGKQCYRTSALHRVLVVLDEGIFKATDLYIPQFVDLRGAGKDKTIIVHEKSGRLPCIQCHLDSSISELAVISDYNAYCIHSDAVNRFLRRDGARVVRQKYSGIDLTGGANSQAWLFGCGISSGEIITFNNCSGGHKCSGTEMGRNSATFGFHNTNCSTAPAYVYMNGCSSRDHSLNAVVIAGVHDRKVATCHLVLNNCNFSCIKLALYMKPSGNIPDLVSDAPGWTVDGVYDGAFLMDAPYGMKVLATARDVAVTGDAADALFGNVDELGRGEKHIGYSRTIGRRLGDCSRMNKTLTIGKQSHIFNTDMTNRSDGEIISEINADITDNPVALVDIQYEFYPDTGFLKTVKNTSGADIDKGSFVKLTGLGTVALCGKNEKPFGWVYRTIRNGYNGKVVVSRHAAAVYLGLSETDNGEFGIDMNGKASMSANPKRGRVAGGLCEIYN